MKKSEMTLNIVVYAILAMIILLVSIGVFFYLTKTPITSIFQIGEDVGGKSEEAVENLGNFFGECEGNDCENQGVS
ncbi:hypothetical protein GF327_06880 [Candidatus Woesearchaeota archaeon]|nr:hypothetical protein [Candidatus Woesearchaeota archaeon]